eukprot:gene10267-11975_t
MKASDFHSTLKYFIKSFGLACTFLDGYDFTLASAQLIISVPGYHKGDQMSNFGHLKLRKELQRYYQQKSTEKPLNCSMGQNAKR